MGSSGLFCSLFYHDLFIGFGKQGLLPYGFSETWSEDVFKAVLLGTFQGHFSAIWPTNTLDFGYVSAGEQPFGTRKNVGQSLGVFQDGLFHMLMPPLDVESLGAARGASTSQHRHLACEIEYRGCLNLGSSQILWFIIIYPIKY